MNFYKKNIFKIFLIILFTHCNLLLAENHDTNKESADEEPLPLNDPFVGDSSFTGNTNIITTSGSQDDQQILSLYNFKLVGIIEGEFESFITLINQDGDFLTLGLHEQLSDGIKLVDLRLGEAVFEKEDMSYVIMNFKNEIKETNEY